MTDTRNDTASVVDRIHPVAGAARSLPRIFSAAWRYSCSARKRWCWLRRAASPRASRSMAARYWRRPWATQRRLGRRRRQGRGNRRQRHEPHHCGGPKASLDRSCRDRTRRRGGLVGGQIGFCSGQGAAQLRRAVHRRRAGLPAKRLSPRHRPLQWRYAVVSQCAEGRSGKAGMEGLASWPDGAPDGRFLVTTMQEPMLHGWRLIDRQHMRMSGYAARVTSLGWTTGGRWLATWAGPRSSSGRSRPRTAPWASSQNY